MIAEDPNPALAHALARIGLGVNIMLQGLVRLPKIAAFAEGVETQFADGPLPAPLVNLAAHVIVVAGASLGLLLVAGWFLRPALVGGMLLIILLLFGTSLIENWSGAGIQMVYLGFHALLLATLRYDRFSADAARCKSSGTRNGDEIG